MDNQELIEKAKAAMEWEENRELTLLEYLRYYKGGTIGEIHIQAIIAEATKKAEVRGQIMAFNYALSKSQVFTYARSIGEIRAGEESGAVPIKVLEDRIAELQAGSEK